jgi:hypothetical protein
MSDTWENFDQVKDRPDKPMTMAKAETGGAAKNVLMDTNFIN